MEKIIKFFKRRKWCRTGRVFGVGLFDNRRPGSCNSRSYISTEKYSRGDNRQNKRYYRKWLLEENGIVVIELLLVSLILVFLTYSGIEYWVVMTQHQQASHLVNKYLAKMSIEGRLSLEDEAALIADFDNIGLNVTEIQAQKESEGEPRVLRNLQDPNSSILKLKVTAVSKHKMFWTGVLVESNAEDNYQIIVGGEILSERYLP